MFDQVFNLFLFSPTIPNLFPIPFKSDMFSAEIRHFSKSQVQSHVCSVPTDTSNKVPDMAVSRDDSVAVLFVIFPFDASRP